MILFYNLFNIILVSSIGYLLWRREPASPIKKYLIPALILKLTGGIFLGLFYQIYFNGGDAQLYQTQSDFVTEYAKVSPVSYLRLLLTRNYESETLRTSMIYVWYSNSYFMVMLLSGLNFLSGGHYYLNSLYFSLFSFWGLWQLVQIITRLYPHLALPAVISFLFFPSVIYWSSGISKEAIYLGSLGWLLAAALRLYYGYSEQAWYDVFALLLAGYLLWKIKFYFAALVFALLITYFLVNFLTGRFRIFQNRGVRLLLLCLVLVTAGFLISRGHEVLRIDYFITQLIKSNTVLAERSAGKPMVSFPHLEPSLISFVRNSPAAVFHTLLRPFIWEGKSLFYFLAGIENLFILFLLFLALFKIARKFPAGLNLGVLLMVLYIFIIAALLSLSTPNIGSLYRYRIIILPFLIFLLISYNHQYLLPDRRKQ